jgi:hypothetical protein
MKMGKIKGVIVVDPTTLKLTQNAEAGDIIDLKELQQLDLSYIQSLISSNQDKVYLQRLADEKAKWTLESSAALEKNKADFTAQIQGLNNRLALKDQEIIKDKQDLQLSALQTENNYRQKISDLSNQLALKDKDKALEVEKAKADKERELMGQLSELKAKLAEAESKERLAVQNAELAKENQLNKELAALKDQFSVEKDNLNKQITEKDKQLSDLQIQKSSSSVKVLGEQLEGWCDNEYKTYAVSGFLNCTWEKDNTLVKDANDPENSSGTKADYIFRVYSSAQHTKENELTSVCMDMKNENPLSKNKKKNEDFYKKLDSDRTKKECQYALLVSELEMDRLNDAPVQKVAEYDNMYMVRPQYFISFLSIVESLGRKYQEMKLEMNRRQEAFKDSKELEEEFEDLKNTYLNKPLDSMEKELTKIKESSAKIADANEIISQTASKLINETLNTMREKIERFNIKKIGREADKING